MTLGHGRAWGGCSGVRHEEATSKSQSERRPGPALLSGASAWQHARAMRVLMLSGHAGGEPGSPGARVASLVAGLGAEGVDVRVITGAPHAADGARAAGDTVVVPEYPPMVPGWDAISSTLQLDLALFEHAIAALLRRPADLVHAHDWTAAHAAIGVRRAFGLPLVTTLHATQVARRRGRLHGRGDELIHQIEWWLAAESARVLTPSRASASRVSEQFAIPPERVAAVASPRAEGRGPAARIARIYADVIAEGASPLRARLGERPNLRALFATSPALRAARA